MTICARPPASSRPRQGTRDRRSGAPGAASATVDAGGRIRLERVPVRLPPTETGGARQVAAPSRGTGRNGTFS